MFARRHTTMQPGHEDGLAGSVHKEETADLRHRENKSSAAPLQGMVAQLTDLQCCRRLNAHLHLTVFGVHVHLRVKHSIHRHAYRSRPT